MVAQNTGLTQFIEIPDFSGDPQQAPTLANIIWTSANQYVALNPVNGLPVTPISGVLTDQTQSLSFVPVGGRNANISVWGTFSATVQLQRSFDNGTTWQPITNSQSGTPVNVFTWTAPASEQFQEDQFGVQYALVCTTYGSGSVSYLISQ